MKGASLMALLTAAVKLTPVRLLPAAACKGTATSGLKFTVLPKLYPFAQAAAACKAAGLKLSDIDLIFAGSKGARRTASCFHASYTCWDAAASMS